MFHMVQSFLFVGRYILCVNTLTGCFVAWLSSWDVTLVDDGRVIFDVECRYPQHATEWAVPFPSVPAVLISPSSFQLYIVLVIGQCDSIHFRDSLEQFQASLRVLVSQLLVPGDVLTPGNFNRNSVPDHGVLQSTSSAPPLARVLSNSGLLAWSSIYPAITVFIFAGLTGAAATAGVVIDSSYAARGHLVKYALTQMAVELFLTVGSEDGLPLD
ncbi:hypothetical protein C8R44DRAFT_749679 [Mycena epipterygia]|nr:hypothetical protein C8R44DRAFT_749679 [Mycena epipterygia]